MQYLAFWPWLISLNMMIHQFSSKWHMTEWYSFFESRISGQVFLNSVNWHLGKVSQIKIERQWFNQLCTKLVFLKQGSRSKYLKCPWSTQSMVYQCGCLVSIYKNILLGQAPVAHTHL
jgi:hypothetical protein